MAVIVYYSFLNDIPSLIQMSLMDLFSILSAILIIKASSNQPDAIKKPQILRYIGIISIIHIIILRLLPNIALSQFSMGEYQIFKIFNFSKSLIYYFGYFFSLGILMVYFGKINYQHYSRYLKDAGVFMTVTFTIGLILAFIRYQILMDLNFAIYNPPAWKGLLDSFYRILGNISTTIMIIGVGIFIVHAKQNNDNYFLYAILCFIFRDLGIGPLLMLITFLFPF